MIATAEKKVPPPPSPLSAAQALATQARLLDSRLRAAHQSDRQTTRRAAAHLTALARRLSLFLSRNPSLLPAVPSQSRRVRHHVLHVLPERTVDEAIMGDPIVGDAAETTGAAAEVQILTLGTNGMLRLGTMQTDGALIWRELDPMEPPPGWELDVLLRLLGRALGRVEEHVAAVETRVRDRARALTRLMDQSRKPGTPAEEPAVTIAAPAARPKAPPTLDDAIELATRKLAAVAPDPAPPAAPTPAAARKAPARKHLFERLREK